MTFQFPGFSHRLHLDFETFSEKDIRKCGAHAYAEDPSTEVLMLGWAVDDEPEQLWLPHLEPQMPERLRQFLVHPSVAKVAFNATFERLISKHVLDIDVPAREWRCTMVCAYYLGFKGGLDDVLAQSPLPFTKDPRGQQLIQTFSKPAPKNHHARRYDWSNKPAEFNQFGEYCRQDVRVERELLLWLAKFPMMHDWDWHRYELDQVINDRGVYIDAAMADGAREIWEQEKASLTSQIKEVTLLSKVTREPFKEWLRDKGVVPATMGRDDLLPYLKKDDCPDIVKQAITLWVAKEGKAVTKFTSMIAGLCLDGRAKGLFQFKGASRTDRTAGRRIQLQNLRRSFAEKEEIGSLVQAIRTGNAGILRMVAGEWKKNEDGSKTRVPVGISDALGGAVRHALQAAPGKTLVVYDLTSIESVVLGWLTYSDTIDRTFRQGQDTYKMFAMNYYGVGYDDVTKEQRSFSKPPVLGCGYMLGWKGLIAYAEGYGVQMEESESRRAVETFRSMYPEIPQFWNWIYEAVKYVVVTGQTLEGYRLRIERDEDFMRIWLPSGRALSYYKPEVRRRPAPWADVEATGKNGCQYTVTQLRNEFSDKDDIWLEANGWITVSQWIDNVSYMGENQTSNKWTRIYAHAGLFTENIVQSMAMDILFHGIELLEADGVPIVLQVHDELASEVEQWQAPYVAEVMKKHMATPPPWAEGMWLGAAGYISNYYMKD